MPHLNLLDGMGMVDLVLSRPAADYFSQSELKKRKKRRVEDVCNLLSRKVKTDGVTAFTFRKVVEGSSFSAAYYFSLCDTNVNRIHRRIGLLLLLCGKTGASN